MTRPMIACLVVLLALANPADAGEANGPSVNDLAWLAGAWHEVKNGVTTEENWLAPAGDLMLGVNRTVRPGGKASFEFLRIARAANGVSYFASPQGRPAVEFPLIQMEKRKVVFENSKHDFPQRITYWLADDGALHARVSGTIQGKERAMEWRWQKRTATP